MEKVQKTNTILNATLSNGRRKPAIMSSSSAENPMKCELLEAREDSVVAVQRMLVTNESRFEIVSFQKYNAVAKLRSLHYDGYFVICHIKSLRSTGWLLCLYALNAGCTLEKELI